MSLWDSITRFLALEPWAEPEVQARSLPTEMPPAFLARFGVARTRPWLPPSVREALGVPTIFAAVNLIANVMGSLTMEAKRGTNAVPADERPRLIVRPDPFTTPREFFRATAYSMATRGEAWWWVAMRDTDGMALSLIPLDPAEVMVTENTDDPLRPKIEWRMRRMRNEDMVQIVYSREPGALRGWGPLQACGAAISVAVESQEWAANYYAAGGVPPLVVKAAGYFSESDEEDEEGLKRSEADIFAQEWMNKPANQPRVIDQNVESVTTLQQNQQGGQMLQARSYQAIEVARMFLIPGAMLDAVESGSTVTYQNREGLWGEFLERCLLPGYMEPIEQAMSDLLTRSTVARFNRDALLAADIKTRYEVYATGIDKGIMTPEYVQSREGIIGGDIENAPIPFSPPQAVPTTMPMRTRSEDVEFRCDGMTSKRRHGIVRVEKCGRLLARAEAFIGACPRCKKEYPAA